MYSLITIIKKKKIIQFIFLSVWQFTVVIFSKLYYFCNDQYTYKLYVTITKSHLHKIQYSIK